jgi:hypothetical protein
MYEKTAASVTSAASVDHPRAGATVPLDFVASPGTYVCNWSGHLLRIPQRSLLPSGALAVNIVGGEPLTVTKISDDPDLPLSAARGLAWRFGLSVGF